MTTYEQLQAKIRETPLLERLKQIPTMISAMCSNGRPPKMSIPVQATDEDIFITTTVEDAITTEGRITELRTALAKQDHEISQILGRALGYPRFADDQKNFPGATDADGVCVGEHVAETLASEAAGRIKTLTGAMAAQDGRERAAGALCGIPYEEHGCDWPDAVAERLVAVREQRDAAQADAAALRRFLIASIRQLGDPAFLITYQSGKQLVAEIRRAMAAQLEAPHPGESLLAELTAARTEVTTLKQAIQRYQSACEREIRASVQEMLQSGEEISNDIGDAAEVMFSLVSKEAQ